MTKIVFRTPTLLDISAFVMFGVSAKPNTNNPIGFFGTGLKYAIAVLVRENIPVSVFVGETEYVFYKKTGKFRDQTFEQIMMKKRAGFLARWQYVSLPFTTKFGQNWKLWQVLRELHSNTLDEGGTSYGTDGGDHQAEAGVTKIIVDSDLFAEEFRKIGNIFLPGAQSSNTSWSGITDVQILEKPGKHVYYRGLRVFDIPEKMQSIYTYNILAPMELTEDRTIKYDFYMYRAICNQLAVCDDLVMARSVASAGDNFLEGRLDWSWCSVKMSPEMMDAVDRYSKKTSRIFSYASQYAPPAIRPRNWREKLADAIDASDDVEMDEICNLIVENKTALVKLLRGTE